MKTVKTLIGLLLVSASLTSVTSCKDYDEDNYNELRTEIANQNQKLTELLNNQINSLKQQMELIKCTCDPKAIDQKIADAIADYLKNHPNGMTEAEIRQLIEKETLNFVTQEQLNNAVTILQTAITNLENKEAQDVQDLLNKINQANQAAADAQALAQQALNLAQQNGTKIEGLESAIQGLQQTIQGLSTDVQKALQDAAEAKAQAEANKAQIEAIWAAINALNPTMPDLSGFVTYVELQNKLNNYYTKEQINGSFYTKEQINSMIAEYYTKAEIDQKLNNFYTKNDVDNKLTNYYTQSQIDSKLANYYTKAELYTKSEITTLLANYATTQQLNDKADEVLTEAKSYADGLFAQCYTKAEIDTKVSELNTMISTLETTINTQITGLQTQINTINSTLTTIQSEITALTNRVEKIEDALAKQVTGIIIQQTDNSAFGTLALPLDVNSNILMVYYGEALNDINFPNSSIGTPKTFIGGGERIIDYKTGNAGKVYLTINPNTVDFTGLNITLVNSQDEECAIKLSNVKKSDKVLEFGYSRAANNGFYEADATLDEANIASAKLTVDKDGLQSSLKRVLNEHSFSSVADFTGIVAKAINSIRPVAYGTKCEWTDQLGTHAVYSEYDLAAMAVKPLGFYSIENAVSGVSSVPGYNQAVNFINKIWDKVQTKVIDKVNKELDKRAEKLEQRAIIDIEFNTAGQDMTITLSYKGADEVYTYLQSYIIPGSLDTANKTFKVKFQYDEYSDIVEGLAIQDLKTTVDMAADLVEQIRRNTSKLTDDKYINKVLDLLEKVNDKAVSAIHKSGQLLQPALLVNSDKGLGLAGFRGAKPTVSGSITLLPTTYSAELLCPVYKKFVKVDDNVVADGSACEKKIEIGTLSAGEHKIIYSALDYHGNVITREYYIEVE